MTKKKHLYCSLFQLSYCPLALPTFGRLPSGIRIRPLTLWIRILSSLRVQKHRKSTTKLINWRLSKVSCCPLALPAFDRSLSGLRTRSLTLCIRIQTNITRQHLQRKSNLQSVQLKLVPAKLLSQLLQRLIVLARSGFQSQVLLPKSKPNHPIISCMSFHFFK